MDRRILLAAGTVAAAIALFLVFRPGDDDEAAPATTGETTSGTTGETTPTGETTIVTTTETAPAAARVELRVQGGRPVGGVERVELQQGDRVLVLVRSDVADEVHVHGYDLMQDVAPGKPGRIAFRARLAGSFEVELESRHLLLAELQVQP
jgi:hypothetical protein